MYNLSENLKVSASKFPSHTSIVFMGQRITYAQLDQLVDHFAACLQASGIKKGDHVALLLGNSPQFIVAYYGILRTGAVVVPVNPLYAADEIAFILSDCQVKAVVALKRLQPLFDRLQEHLYHLGLIIYDDNAEEGGIFADFLGAHDRKFVTPDMVENDLAVILYTSGTTGHPKGAMLTHKNLSSNAESCVQFFGVNSSDRFVVTLPMFHVFCMTICLNAPVLSGAQLIVIPKFSPIEAVSIIRKEQATIFAGVPTMYNFLLQLPHITEKDFSSIRVCASGGAPMPVSLLKKFEERFYVTIVEGYGLSEASPVTAFNPLTGKRKLGSIGHSIPGVTNKVVNEDGNEVPRGEIGELIVKGPNVMVGYFGMLEATKAALNKGWLYTGDMARMDEEGYIYIVDRKKDMIIVGGYNVYPREVEEILYQHPSVREAAVIGVPDTAYGEAVKAFIATNDNQLTSADILLFCREKLIKYKIPTEIKIVDSLPKNSTGKILRKALKEKSTK